MKRFIYISLSLLSVAFASVSCSNEEKDLFDESAAQRSETAANKYETLLKANGGKWYMEYFTNSDEPGYSYVVTFKNDGTVVVSGDNRWIGGTFQTETSLWDIISDNGPVLSFSSYNTIFHIFSTPEDFDDPDGASTTTTSEQGYGHEGDYEFVLMAGDENTIRLKGKKYGYTIYLRHIDPNVSDEEYLASVETMKNKLFNDKFNSLIITDGTGERFVLTAASIDKYAYNGKTSCGVYNIYPEAGDAVTQVVQANAIITADGLRFANEVKVSRAAEPNDSVSFQSFKYQESNGTLVCEEDNNIVVTAPDLADMITNTSYTWTMDSEELGGAFATDYAAIDAQLKTVFKNKRNLSSIALSSSMLNNVMTNSLKLTAGSSTANYFITSTRLSKNSVSLVSNGSSDNNGRLFLQRVSSIQTLIDLLGSSQYELSAESLINPSRIKLTSTTNSADYFYVTIKQ